MATSPVHDGCFIGDGKDKPTNWKLGPTIARNVNTIVSHVIDVNKLHKEKCAVKQAFISDDTDVTSLADIESELKAYQKIKHRRILEYIGYSRSDQVFSLFLPYMEKGSLASYIKSQDGGHLTEEKTALFSSQILEGLDYLHRHNIIHRDIKASNILMKNDFEVKISDFGVAKILNTLTKAHTAGTGTFNWMAPELFQRVPYDNKVDIWSLGCTVYQMIKGKPPFTELSDAQLTARALENKHTLCAPEYVSLHLKDFLRLMCMKTPTERPEAFTLMTHKYITENASPLSVHPKYSEAWISKYPNSVTGTHEVQECLEGQGEIDLHTHQANCVKNSGHKNFVPVNQISVELFPSGYHDNDLCDLTKALADLTVRIAVKLTSPDRPEFVPGTKDPYPCYNTRGQNSLRTGTGRVSRVSTYTEGMYGYKTCPCPECDHSDTPSKVWWEVEVLTATHVVFDESEARQSSCRLWFDDDLSPVFNISGWKVDVSYTKGDKCKLYCATHDVDVADKLDEMVRRFDGLCKKVSYIYKRRRDVDKLTIIVSHPHGCSKQVSVGHWVHRQEEVGGATRYTYTTSTCPGSSGALVYRLGCFRSLHHHIGANSDGLNYSGLCWD